MQDYFLSSDELSMKFQGWERKGKGLKEKREGAIAGSRLETGLYSDERDALRGSLIPRA